MAKFEPKYSLSRYIHEGRDKSAETVLDEIFKLCLEFHKFYAAGNHDEAMHTFELIKSKLFEEGD
jgi:hypothetical protein